jgi:CheY-like chemotaxis protein
MTEPHDHTVLIVDDDRDTLQTMEAVLGIIEMNVRTAHSGYAAIDLVAAGLRPCLMLVDLRMPVLDGWETLKQIRRLPGMASSPAVAFTGEPPDYARAARAGFDGYLRKPVTYELVVETVQRHCRPDPTRLPPEAHRRAS